jgi:hypothetical protein
MGAVVAKVASLDKVCRRAAWRFGSRTMCVGYVQNYAQLLRTALDSPIRC